MRQGYTDITILLDRSASMKRIADATIEGFNDFVREQQQLAGEIKLTLVQFNTRRKVVFEAAPIGEVPRLDREEYRPKGGTALLDALAVTVDDTGRRLAALAEHDRPTKVLLAILTDGKENSSGRFSYTQIAERINHQQDVYKWEFLFLGANQDAIREAAKLAIRADAALTFSASADGSGKAFKSLSKAAGDTHSRKKNKAGFDEEDRKAQEPPTNTK